MIDTAKLFTDKQFPRWFEKHPIFKEVKTIKKVFPGIGLPNFEEDIPIDNTHKARRAANQLITRIRRQIDFVGKNGCKAGKKPNKKATAEQIKAAEDRKFSSTVCSAVHSCLYKNRKDVVQSTNGRISIKLPSDITIEGQDKPLFRKNESVFRVYNKVREMLAKHKSDITPLEDMNEFKTFSTENVPNASFKIVFSSDGSDGAWDIATMSSRGIRSCQSWDGGDYKHCTIGSVIDPFVGIIYMTGGGVKGTQYGSKMIRRCLVRFAVDGDARKPFLIVDRMYPSVDRNILKQFKSALSTKLGDNIPVKCMDDDPYETNIPKNSYIPLTEIRDKLRHTSVSGKERVHSDADQYTSIISYQDYKLKDGIEGGGRDEKAKLFAKNSLKKERKFVDGFSQHFVNSMKSIDCDKVAEVIKPAVQKLTGNQKRGFDYGYSNYTFFTKQLANKLADMIVASVDKKSFNNSDNYIIRVHYAYLNRKREIVSKNHAELTKFINGQLGLKPNHRFTKRNFIAMMESVYPELDKAMKENLRVLVKERKITDPLPLP